MAITRNSSWPSVVALVLLMIVGGFFRLHNLGEKTVTHVEMYVPGIRLPHGISYPEERLTLVKVLTSTLNSDTHPPAFYMMMWFWTKIFGTTTWAMRLPSGLLGTACIPLVFWLGVLTRQEAAGWIAAALVAVNGHLVFWSQVARMFTFACCLGLLATILLLRVARQPHPSQTLRFLYVAIMLLGLCTHIFFWLILAAHMFWTQLSAYTERLPLPGAAKLQFLVLILGSPLLASSAYQSGNTLAALSSNVFVYAREYVQFGFAFPLLGYSSGVFPARGSIPLTDDPHLSVARWLFFLLSLALFTIGVCSINAPKGRLLTDTSGPSYKSCLLAALAAALAILLFVFVAKAYARPPNPSLRTSQKMIILPFLLAVGAIIIQKGWNSAIAAGVVRLRNQSHHSVPGHAPSAGSGEAFSRADTSPDSVPSGLQPAGSLLASDQALVLILAVLPFAVLAVISLFKPMFNARGLILVVPYLLLVLAAGVVALGRKHVVLAVIVLVAIGAAHDSGLKAYNRMSAGRTDYRAFAAALSPEIQSTDLVFLNPEFYSTPLFYYITSNWNRFVGGNYEESLHENPQARIWALCFYNYEPSLSPAITGTLSNYRVARVIEVPGGRASLYVPQ